MITGFQACEDYDMSYRSIALAHTDTSSITIMPLIGDRILQCFKFDDEKQKLITYSHHTPPHQSDFMPAAIAKRFMSLSLDGRYLAISWQPLNVDAELDPSKTFVLIYKTEKYKPTSHSNNLLKVFESNMPNCTIRFQGGCSFLPDGRLVLINDTHLRIIELIEHINGELEGEESYSVDLRQDLDDDGVTRSDFYDDLPEIKDVVATNKSVELKKIKKSVTFKDLPDAMIVQDVCQNELDADDAVLQPEEEDTTSNGSDSANVCITNDIFYEAADEENQQDQHKNLNDFNTLDEEEIEIITENELNSDDDFIFMKNATVQQIKEIVAPATIDQTSNPTNTEKLEDEEDPRSSSPPLPNNPKCPDRLIKYDDESNTKRIDFIKKHAKSLKQSGSIFVTSDYRHNIWKIERNSIKLFFSISKARNVVYRDSDDEYVFAISKFNNMVIVTSQYSTFKPTAKSDSTAHQTAGFLDVYDTCSGSVIAHLSLPKNRKSVNAILQVSFIQKDMYVLAVTYHYEASNHPSQNCYYLDIWDIGSGTHLAGKPITSEVGYMPDSQFFINESIKLRYGCGAFIRAFPKLPPSLNSGCVDKSNGLLSGNISSVTAHLIPLFEDGRKKEVYDGNSQKDFVISSAAATAASLCEEDKSSNNSSDVFYIWSKTKQPSSSYSRRIPALSFPMTFLDNDKTYIMIVFKNDFNSRISIWKLLATTNHTSSGPLMTIHEKQVVYSLGSTSANYIERCFGAPAVMFDPSRVLSSTSHSLNGRISHSSSFIVPSNIDHSNANNVPVLVFNISQKDTNNYRTKSKDTYNNNPNHIEFDYSTDNSLPLFHENVRKCCIAIPLLTTSMLECALHTIVNENEQVENISKLYYSQVFCKEIYGGTPISKSQVLQHFSLQIPKLFTTVAGTQLLTRLARGDRHNYYLEFILNYLTEADIYYCHLHTVVSLKKGFTHTHALREAFVSQSWENVKSITKYITGDKIINGTNFYLLEKYKSFIDQVVEHSL